MKRTLLAAILATAAIAFSCSMEESGSLQSGSVVTEPTVTIAPFVAGVATKTTASFENNVASFAFANGDVLRAYPVAPEQGDGIRFTLKGEPGTTCVFEGSGFGLMEGQEYAAYYPGGSETVPEVTAVPVSFLGQSQPAASEWNLSDVDFLYATGIEPVNGACSFSMKHLGALLIIDVTFEEAGVYKELTLSSDCSFIAKGTVDLTQDDIELAFDETKDLVDDITLALGGDNGMAVEANQTVTFYMMMAPDDMQAQAELTVTITDVNDKVTVLKQGTGFAFESGKAYKFGSTVEAPVVPVIDPGNLSANGTANCYIVDVDNIVEEGYYFTTVVAGNGVNMAEDFVYMGYDLAIWPQNGNAALIAGSEARVLFNQNDCIKEVTYDATDRTIHFKATGNKGNAKVCININNINFWTWHIWCTDQPSTIEFTNETNNYTFTVMDRNLGATCVQDASDLEAMDGLYYQWGVSIPWRPADFPKTTPGWNNSVRSLQTIYWSPETPGMWSSGAVGNIGTSGTHGNQFPTILWGGGSKGAQDGSLDSKYFISQGNNSKKTMYDPCPVGYKVAPYDFLNGYNATIINGGSSNITVNNYGLVLAGDNGGEVLLPYNGFAWYGSDDGYGWGKPGVYGQNDPCYLCLWTSAYNNTTVAPHIVASANSETKINSGSIIQLEESNAHAWGVRCVAE